MEEIKEKIIDILKEIKNEKILRMILAFTMQGQNEEAGD